MATRKAWTGRTHQFDELTFEPCHSDAELFEAEESRSEIRRTAVDDKGRHTAEIVAGGYCTNSQWSPVITRVALSDGLELSAEAMSGKAVFISGESAQLATFAIR